MRRADGARHGVTGREIYRDGLWGSRLQGVHSWEPVVDEGWMRTLEAAEEMPADAVVTGWPVLKVLGVDWLDGTAADGGSLPIPICTATCRRPRVGILPSVHGGSGRRWLEEPCLSPTVAYRHRGRVGCGSCGWSTRGCLVRS